MTDVLSFPSGDGSGGGSLGDLAISRQRAAEQAVRFGHTATAEVQLLMLHGLLHLMGMDHERDRGEMARAESSWRTMLGLPLSLIERATA